MKVLFVINALGEGGTEKSTAELLPLLREQGIDTTLAILGSRGDEGVEPLLRSRGFEIVELASGLRNRIEDLRRLIGAVEPDLVHSALFDANIAARASRPRGVPLLTSLVNLSYGVERLDAAGDLRRKLRLTQFIDALTGLRSSHFHAVSEAVAASARRTLMIPRSQMTVVPRGRPDLRTQVSTGAREATRRELGIPENDVVLVNVGRQEAQKGHTELLEAVAPLLASNPALHLVIAGREGNESPAIQSVLETLDGRDRVHVVGHRKDVPDLLSASDVFVFPSRYEGMPGAVLEAMAIGLPVVASDIGPNREVLGDAELVPVGQPRILTAAIAALLSSPNERDRQGSRNRERFQSTFTIERSASEMADLYRRLVDRR